jgi:hypothetical protein
MSQQCNTSVIIKCKRLLQIHIFILTPLKGTHFLCANSPESIYYTEAWAGVGIGFPGSLGAYPV